MGPFGEIGGGLQSGIRWGPSQKFNWMPNREAGRPQREIGGPPSWEAGELKSGSWRWPRWERGWVGGPVTANLRGFLAGKLVGPPTGKVVGPGREISRSSTSELRVPSQELMGPTGEDDGAPQ